MKTHKLYYGWVVAICCTMLAFSLNAMGNNSLTFYITPVAEALGASRAAINFAFFTMGMLSRTACGFFFGRLAGRFGIKRLMVVGFLFVVAGFTTFSLATNIVMIGIGSALYGVAHAIGTMSSYNVIINNWFVKNKGIALGILNTSIGLGGMVINPLVSHWIIQHGWNQSFLNTIILISAIAIPSLFLVKESPEKAGVAGESAENVAASPQGAPGAADIPEAAPSLGALIKTTRFWMVAAVMFLVGFSVYTSFINAIPSLQATGLPPAFTANILSVVLALGITVGHLLSGYIYQKHGLTALMTVSTLVVGAGMVSMGFLHADSGTLVPILTIFGVGYGNVLALGVLMHLINNIFVGQKKYFSGLFGCLFAIQNTGSIIGAPITGAIFDRTGTYQAGYLMSAALLVVIYILFRISLRMVKKSKTGEVGAVTG